MLALLFLRGDPAAGDELFRSLQGLIRGIVSRVIGPNRRSEWEDATQICNLHGLSALRRWREECPCCCFLATCTARRCISLVRELDANRHVPLTQDVASVDSPNLPNIELMDRCDLAVKEFPMDYQEAWRQYLNDTAIKEIAAKLGLRERSIYYRLAAVRARLIEIAEESGIQASRFSLQVSVPDSSVNSEAEL